MTRYAALLRAVNGGGTGKPPMADLKRMGEEIALGEREIFIHYGEGQADSKLRVPAAAEGTGRNMNTIAKLVELTGKL